MKMSRLCNGENIPKAIFYLLGKSDLSLRGIGLMAFINIGPFIQVVHHKASGFLHPFRGNISPASLCAQASPHWKYENGLQDPRLVSLF